MGELFKLNMLTGSIMFDCIERLLKQESDEESIECLCRLLTTIGKELDKPSNRAKMNCLFEKLEWMASDVDGTPARVFFTILDLIDLRKRGWTPIREGPLSRAIELAGEHGNKHEEVKLTMTNTKNNMQFTLGPSWNK